jgi:DNA-directed RNA polymerase subunit RPC12/RpoP
MKYVCLDCKKTFLYCGKIVQTSKLTANDDDVQEFYACPHCWSKNVDEFHEPELAISSVKSVPLEEVDGLLKEGYVVRELYAHSATLVKETKQP